MSLDVVARRQADLLELLSREASCSSDSNRIAQMACRRSVCDGNVQVSHGWPDIRLYERFDAVSAPLIVGSGREDAWARLSAHTCLVVPRKSGPR